MKNLTKEQFETLSKLADDLKEMSEYNYKPILVHKNCIICQHYTIRSGNLMEINIHQSCDLDLNVDICEDRFKLLRALEPW